MREIGHFIGGKEVKGTSGHFGDFFNPNTGEVQARVALAAKSEVENAIANAQAAFPGWAATNPQRRARVMFRFLELIQAEGAPVYRSFTTTMSDQPVMQSLIKKRPEYLRRLPTPVADQAAREVVFIPHNVFLGTRRDMEMH